GSLVAAALALALSLLVTRSIRELVRDIRAVGLGDLEHRSRIDSADEVGDVARALNRMASNLREAERAKIARKALENELAIASKIQKRLVPTERPQVPGVDIAVHWQPAREVGGDYFDFIPIDSEHLGLVIADVSGKGIPAALVMTMTRSLLRMAATANRSPREALIEVDRAISADLRTGLFVTATYAVLDQRTLALSLARAGHNAPLLWLAREKRMQRIEPRGAAIGIDRGRGLVSRELDEEMIRLRPGDVLVLHTDGVTEAKNEKDEDYGEERLARIIESRASASASASSVLEAILEDIESHRGRRMISDDTTIIVLTGTGTSS
ncbi:MAG TPA: PP2C family protein-serine/threonine phosphatase, partial [Planctomycetota bacterium]|nr:PP2C family protein-serine/threonine phosphatase [Planctomycetota bacterium]